jgi:ribosomal-protein-alanine N-acetyltransferase
MNFEPSMTALGPLDTARLRLRSLGPSDAQFILGHFSDPQVCRYLMDAEPFQKLEEAQRLISYFMDFQRTRAYRWGIRQAQSDQPIGTIGYLHWDGRNNSAEIGFDLDPGYWGRGFMREALVAVIDAGLRHLGLNRLWAVVHPDNRRCLASLAGLGFVTEGVARELFYFRGQYYDHACLSLLKSDWLARPPAADERRG